jgi:protein SCO1
VKAAVLVLITVIAACSSARQDDARRYQLTGTVVGRETSPDRVVIAHDAVAGLMPAMTMPFEVRGATPAVREGDRLAATLAVTDSRSWLENVSVTGSGEAASSAGVAGARRALPGVMVPDFELLDHNGRSFRMRKLTGHVVVVTFIYSRCPLPDFCPLMVKNLERIQSRANDSGIDRHLSLLGITLDPAFDTPAVLTAYGKAMLKDPSRFEHWTLATGTAAQIQDVAGFFGVGYRPEAGFVTHDLATAVVAPDGRVMQVFPSNSWLPEAVFERVRQGAELVKLQ